MKRYLLIASIALIVVGFVSARVGDSLSAVTEDGVVQDSVLMPIGALLTILGLLALVVAGLWYVVEFVRGGVKNAGK